MEPVPKEYIKSKKPEMIECNGSGIVEKQCGAGENEDCNQNMSTGTCVAYDIKGGNDIYTQHARNGHAASCEHYGGAISGFCTSKTNE